MAREASQSLICCSVHFYKAAKIVLLLLIATLTYISWLQYKKEVDAPNLSIRIPFVKEKMLWTKDEKKWTRIYKIEFTTPRPQTNSYHDGEGHHNDNNILQNISLDLYSNQLITEVLDEPYILKRDNYFKPKNSVDNGFTPRFVLDGRSVCKKTAPYLLILIPSVVEDEAHRYAIRSSWMKGAENNDWPNKVTINKSIRHVFFLGQRSYSLDRDKELVLGESKSYGDIVLADLIDTYEDLSRKIVTALQWVDMFCPGVQYVLKCDQDTFVNVPLMLRLLLEVESQRNETKFVLGKNHFVQPAVVRKGRWAVSKDEYPLRYFPLYAYGHTYIISGQAIPAMVSVANQVPLVSPEDVYITGLLPKASGVTRLHAECFAVCCRDIFDCEVVWNYFVSMTSLSRPHDHPRLWATIKSGECHPNSMFNAHLRLPKFPELNQTET